jgi:hypothetical protein
VVARDGDLAGLQGGFDGAARFVSVGAVGETATLGDAGDVRVEAQQLGGLQANDGKVADAGVSTT